MENRDIFKVHMPEVDRREGLKPIFDQAKHLAGEEVELDDGSRVRQVVIISPGRLLLKKESYLPDTLPSENRAVLEDLIPSEKPLKIAVITYTFLDALRENVRKAIPFFDYLLGFACIGHSLWIFEGHTSVLEMGCAGADFVLVDQRMLPFLEPDWEKRVKGVASKPQVRIITVNG
jgi:hypothetical protein